jgi:hypothetical protein
MEGVHELVGGISYQPKMAIFYFILEEIKDTRGQVPLYPCLTTASELMQHEDKCLPNGVITICFHVFLY